MRFWPQSQQGAFCRLTRVSATCTVLSLWISWNGSLSQVTPHPPFSILSSGHGMLDILYTKTKRSPSSVTQKNARERPREGIERLESHFLALAHEDFFPLALSLVTFEGLRKRGANRSLTFGWTKTLWKTIVFGSESCIKRETKNDKKIQKQTLICFASKSKFSFHVVFGNFGVTIGNNWIAGLPITLEILKVFEIPLAIPVIFRRCRKFSGQVWNLRRSSDNLRINFTLD